MDLNYAVHLTGLDDLIQRFPQVAAQVMKERLQIIAARVEKAVVEKTPSGVGAQGGLSGSIHGEVISYGSGFAAQIGTPFEYGEVIELGRRAGARMPPTDPIALWAVRKLGISQKDAKSVAFAIARKIALKGFPGVHMFERTLQELEGWIMTELNNIPGLILQRI